VRVHGTGVQIHLSVVDSHLPGHLEDAAITAKYTVPASTREIGWRADQRVYPLRTDSGSDEPHGLKAGPRTDSTHMASFFALADGGGLMMPGPVPSLSTLAALPRCLAAKPSLPLFPPPDHAASPNLPHFIHLSEIYSLI